MLGWVTKLFCYQEEWRIITAPITMWVLSFFNSLHKLVVTAAPGADWVSVTQPNWPKCVDKHPEQSADSPSLLVCLPARTRDWKARDRGKRAVSHWLYLFTLGSQNTGFVLMLKYQTQTISVTKNKSLCVPFEWGTYTFFICQNTNILSLSEVRPDFSLCWSESHWEWQTMNK